MPSWTLAELAQATQTELRGHAHKIINAVAAVDKATENDISYVRDKHFAKFLADSKAGALILPADLAKDFRGHCLVSRNPYLSYAQIVTLMNPLVKPEIGIHPTAVVASDALLAEGVSVGAQAVIESGVQIGANTLIGAGSVIGRNTRIGRDGLIHPNVTIASFTEIGARVILHSGCVLGADGFGFVPQATGWYKIPQIGYVSLGDDVEIGANTTVDRAAMGVTRLGNGVKLDNLIHIAHGVEIGDHTVIAACTGIAGSAKIGAFCQISGMCSIAGHISVADRVTITATSFVINSITESGVYSSGTTVDEHGLWRKNAVRFRQLDQMARRLAALEKQLATLQGSSTGE